MTGIRATCRARDLVAMGSFLGAGHSPVRGELFSLLFFATEFHNALIELGREDAQRWLSLTHDDGPWRYGDPPLPDPIPAPAPLRRKAKATKRPRAKATTAA
jgi:hypothetical protein